MPDGRQHPLECSACGAPGKAVNYCGCADYDCGAQNLCSAGDLALPGGFYRSKACANIEQKGGWNAA